MLGVIIGGERMNGDRGIGRIGEVNGDKAGVMVGGEKIFRLFGFCVVGLGFRTFILNDCREILCLKIFRIC